MLSAEPSCPLSNGIEGPCDGPSAGPAGGASVLVDAGVDVVAGAISAAEDLANLILVAIQLRPRGTVLRDKPQALSVPPIPPHHCFHNLFPACLQTGPSPTGGLVARQAKVMEGAWAT